MSSFELDLAVVATIQAIVSNSEAAYISEHRYAIFTPKCHSYASRGCLLILISINGDLKQIQKRTVLKFMFWDPKYVRNTFDVSPNL